VLCLQYVTTQLDMLGHMDPWEYQQIRVVLGHGSGFDSPGFRQVARVTRRRPAPSTPCSSARASS
jgi:tryptophan 2,3-dioxygenase